MAEKILKTRIQLKIDTIENWNANKTVKLLPGEVAIATIKKLMPPPPNPDGTITGDAIETTEFLMKVGQTGKKFEELEWVSAKAADVYGWAKEANLKITKDANAAISIGSYINDISSNSEGLVYKRTVFDTSITDTSTDNNVPSSLAVKNYAKKNYMNHITALKPAILPHIGEENDKKVDGLVPFQDNTSEVDRAIYASNKKHGADCNGSIVLRDKNNNFEAATPTKDDHVATKKYVDEKAVGSFSGTNTDTITPKAIDGTSLTSFTVNNVANAKDCEKLGGLPPEKYVLKSEFSTAMVFKGTLGTGSDASINFLPTPVTDSASANNTVGDTYKVINVSTYHVGSASGEKTYKAEEGDVFICDDKGKWILIPSGDEPSGTVTSVAVQGTDGVTATGGPITSSGTITVSHAVPSGASVGTKSGNDYIKTITTDKFGHITAYTTGTDKDTDTKNTAGATDISEKIYIVGAKTQSANPQTYTHDTAYVDANGCLYSGGQKVLTSHQSHQSIKTLDTTAATAQPTNASEDIKGTGKITLHKISKTGNYNDLNNKPTIPTVGNGKFSVEAGDGLTQTGTSYGTANQSDNTKTTLNVGAGTGIETAPDSVSVKDYNNILTAKSNNLQTENGITIIFNCGSATEMV